MDEQPDLPRERRQQSGWNEWAHRVLGDIERIDSKLETVIEKINLIKVDIAVLKTKAAMVGAVWGAVVSLVVALVVAYVKHILP